MRLRLCTLTVCVLSAETEGAALAMCVLFIAAALCADVWRMGYINGSRHN